MVALGRNRLRMPLTTDEFVFEAIASSATYGPAHMAEKHSSLADETASKPRSNSITCQAERGDRIVRTLFKSFRTQMACEIIRWRVASQSIRCEDICHGRDETPSLVSGFPRGMERSTIEAYTSRRPSPLHMERPKVEPIEKILCCQESIKHIQIRCNKRQIERFSPPCSRFKRFSNYCIQSSRQLLIRT